MNHLNTSLTKCYNQDSIQSAQASDEDVIEALEEYFRRSALSSIHSLPRWMP